MTALFEDLPSLKVESSNFKSLHFLFVLINLSKIKKIFFLQKKVRNKYKCATKQFRIYILLFGLLQRNIQSITNAIFEASNYIYEEGRRLNLEIGLQEIAMNFTMLLLHQIYLLISWYIFSFYYFQK